MKMASDKQLKPVYASIEGFDFDDALGLLNKL